MRVVLVNPGSALQRTGGLLARFVAPIPPLGLAMLASYLESHGHEVHIVDQYCDGQDSGALVEQVVALRPGLVGFSCLTPNMSSVLEAVALLRQRAPATPIVFGNTHAAVFTDRILSRREADYCVRAEGEEPLLGLVQALEAGREPAGVPNLSWTGPDGRVVHNPSGRPTVPLDALPYPAWHKLPLERYAWHPMIALQGVALPIQGSRGCAYSCTFCAQDQVFQQVRRRDVEAVCDELEHVMRTTGATQFGFIDAYWPLSVRAGHAFIDALERRGLDRRITWVTETRVDKVDRELLFRMKAAGCRLIMYGIEFGTDEQLALTRKNARTSQAVDAIRWSREAGIFTLGLYVIGMPGEDTASVRRTLSFARKLGTDIAKFNIAVPLPGSAFFTEVYGDAVDDLDYDAFSSWYNPFVAGGNLVWTPEAIDGATLVRLQREGMLRYYLRPGFVWNTLRSGAIRPIDMGLGGAALVGDAARIEAVRLTGRVRAWLQRPEPAA